MSLIALVTGANQGLGYALVARLCEVLPAGSAVYLGARDAARGQAAVTALRERGLTPSLAVLDVTDEPRVGSLADALAARHGGVDLVISNAAARIGKDRPASAQVRAFIDTNNHGTVRMLRAFGPRLRAGGRFLVVASSFGSLRHLDPGLHHHFDVARRSLDDVERTMDDYVALVERHAASPPWPEWINIPSKIGQVAATKIAARDRRDVLIAAVCPGLVDTEASRPWFEDMSQAKTPAAAAEDVVWLATTADADRWHGELVRHRAVVPWV